MKTKGTIKSLFLLLTVSFFVFITPFNALALDERYISDRSFWIDKGEVCHVGDEDDSFYAMVTTVSDEANNCFYIYADYTDGNIKSATTDQICFVLVVENSEQSYKIFIKDGEYYGVGGSDASGFVRVISNFDEAVSKSGKGKVFIGVEIVDSYAKTAQNRISCECSLVGNSHSLFDGCVLDLTPETPDSTTGSARTTTSSRDRKQEKETTVKSGGSDGNGGENGKNSTTKFSGSGTTYAGETAKPEDTTGGGSKEIFGTEGVIGNAASSMSPLARGSLAAAIAIILIGILLVLYSLLANRKNNDEDTCDFEEEAEDNEKYEIEY